MKQRIPPDVERLMWIVAESHDPKAISDFQTRFPEFASELARRRRMVSDLRGANPSHPVESHIPAFTPRATQTSSVSRGTWVAGGLALAALAVASYSVTKWATTPPPILPKVEHVNTGPITPPPGPVVVKQPDPVPIPPPVVQHDPNPQPNPPVNNEDIPKTLRLSNTSLVAALKMIGQMAGYNVDVAPGFKDQQVSIDYDSFTTSDMLKDMGFKYNFTAFDQGDGTIIIVPAVDSGGMPSNDPNQSQRRIGG